MAESLLHALRRRHRVDGVADFHVGEIFKPGAGIAVYDPDFYNPVCSLIGAATQVGSAPNPLQPKPVFIPSPTGLVTGLREPLGEFQLDGLSEV
jgi:hypothetical protein